MYWSFRIYMYVHYMYVYTPILHPHPCTHAYGFHEKSYPSWRTRTLENLYPGTGSLREAVLWRTLCFPVIRTSRRYNHIQFSYLIAILHMHFIKLLLNFSWTHRLSKGTLINKSILHSMSIRVLLIIQKLSRLWCNYMTSSRFNQMSNN